MQFVDRLAKGDRSKWEYFLKMGLIEFLNAVSFEQEKGRKRDERLKQSAHTAKSAKDPNVYIIALLQELL